MIRSPRARSRNPNGERSAAAEARQPLDRDAVRQLRRLAPFVRPYRRYLTIALIGVVFASALGLVYPQVLGNLVDTALGADADPSNLDLIALALLGVFAFQAGFNAVRIYFLNIMCEAVLADLRKATYDHIMTLPVKFFDNRKTGEITSRLTSDVAVLQNTVSTSLAQALAQGMTFIGGVVLMFVASPRLSITVLSFLPIAIIAAAVFGRRLRKR